MRLLGPNTNLNAFEDFRDRPRRPVDRARSRSRATRAGPVFQGQEIGIRLTHWAPTGNEVDLEFADFARHFADQPEVGVIACYIEGFKDGRTLMLAADHAAKLRKPIVMVKVGKTDGRPLDGAVAHRPPHRLRRGHVRGVPPVRRDARRRPRRAARGVDGASRAPGPSRSRRGRRRRSEPGRVRVRDLRRHRRAHGRHARRRRACGSPTSPRRRSATLHDGLIPAYLRVSNPVDCGGPPVADARGRKILDVILADKNVDILVVPITGAVVDVQRAVHARPHRRREDHDEADLRGVGRARGHRRHVLQAPARRRPARVPHVRQLRRRR